jgi:protoporphyrinogen oxidase
LRQRAGARKAGGDKLGYLRGSLGRLLEAYAAQLEHAGVPIWTSTPVTSLNQDDGGWLIFCEHEGARQKIHTRVVVAALSGGLLLKLAPQVPAAYGDQLRAIPYRGVICALVELDRSVSGFYWTNLTDRGSSDCVGIIEHTNLISAERYGGRHLIYLAHYVDPDSPIFSAAPDEILSAAEPALRALNPEYSRDWVTTITVSRDRYAQPVPQIGGPMPTLPIETGLPGLLHGSLAHIYPHDRGVAMSLRLGARLAQAALAALQNPGAIPAGTPLRTSVHQPEPDDEDRWNNEGGVSS